MFTFQNLSKVEPRTLLLLKERVLPTNTSELPAQVLSNFQSQRPLGLPAPQKGPACFWTGHLKHKESSLFKWDHRVRCFLLLNPVNLTYVVTGSISTISYEHITIYLLFTIYYWEHFFSSLALVQVVLLWISSNIFFGAHICMCLSVICTNLRVKPLNPTLQPLMLLLMCVWVPVALHEGLLVFFSFRWAYNAILSWF